MSGYQTTFRDYLPSKEGRGQMQSGETGRLRAGLGSENVGLSANSGAYRDAGLEHWPNSSFSL